MLNALPTKPDMAASDAPIPSLGKLGRGTLRRRMMIGAMVDMSVMVSSLTVRVTPLPIQVLGSDLKSPDKVLKVAFRTVLGYPAAEGRVLGKWTWSSGTIA
jgi:hypothetical protein